MKNVAATNHRPGKIKRMIPAVLIEFKDHSEVDKNTSPLWLSCAVIALVALAWAGGNVGDDNLKILTRVLNANEVMLTVGIWINETSIPLLAPMLMKSLVLSEVSVSGLAITTAFAPNDWAFSALM